MGRRFMLLHAVVGTSGRPHIPPSVCLLVLSVVLISSACQTTAPAPQTIAPNVSATVGAAVQMTLQAQPGAQATAPSNGSSLSADAPTRTPVPTVALDETFAKLPQGWPSTPEGP